MRAHCTMWIGLLAVLTVSADLFAQRRGRFRRDGAPPPAAEPKEEAKAEDADKKPERHLAIVGGDVYLGTGQRITGATVLCGDDKILAVGHDLELPDGTEIVDAKGRTVCPGFVCVMGGGMGEGSGSPFVDSVNPFAPQIKQGLAAGITAFLANSPRGGSTPAGDTAVIKLAWGDVEGMVLREGSVLGMSAQLKPTDRHTFDELVEKAKAHQKALAEFRSKPADGKEKEPKAPPGTDTILQVLDGKARLWLQLGGSFRNPFGGGGGSSSDLDSIRDALDLARELGTGVVLVKPTSAWLCPAEIAATDSMAILCPRERSPADPADPDHTGSNLASAALLDAAGIPLAVTCPTGFFGGAGVGLGGILGQDLNTPTVDAAYAVRGGLDNRRALRTLTLDAARILGVDDRIGSLEAGKDADILILDGDPLHYRTFVTVAIVNGKIAYEKSKEPFYSHIQR
ncbi:MAG: amidohydrolase family protein [Planctomycetota bacterium]